MSFFRRTPVWRVDPSLRKLQPIDERAYRLAQVPLGNVMGTRNTLVLDDELQRLRGEHDEMLALLSAILVIYNIPLFRERAEALVARIRGEPK